MLDKTPADSGSRERALIEELQLVEARVDNKEKRVSNGEVVSRK